MIKQRQNEPTPSKTDMLTALPKELKVKILTYLSTEEAVRTSVLSTEWRYTWTSIPFLNFFQSSTIKNLESVVDSVVKRHTGPILGFRCRYSGREVCPEVLNSWVEKFSRKGIKELTLDISGFRQSKWLMEPKFFSCKMLSYVHLKSCSLDVPDDFQGFSLLRTLQLDFVRISEGGFENMVCKSPLLEKLNLQSLQKSICLNIRAPNLRYLEIGSDFKDLRLSVPKLLSMAIWTNDETMNEYLERLIGDLPNCLQMLELFDSRLYIFITALPERFSPSFSCLKELTLNLGFEPNGEEKAAFALALFQGASLLESLYIHVDVNVLFYDEQLIESIAEFWETIERRDNLFGRLRTMTIFNISAADSIFSFLQFVLRFAPQLQSLTIDKNELDEDEKPTILKNLLILRRISPDAQILLGSLF